jgi:hypothetical protein
MWLGDTLVARIGDAAPGGIAGLRFRVFDTTAPLFKDAGVMTFSTRPEIPGVGFGPNDFAIWAGQPGCLRCVGTSRMSAPGLGPNALFCFASRAAMGANKARCCCCSPARGQKRAAEYGSGSMWGSRPPRSSATSFPVAGAIEMPSMLWPAAIMTFGIRVRPMMGRLS